MCPCLIVRNTFRSLEKQVFYLLQEDGRLKNKVGFLQRKTESLTQQLEDALRNSDATISELQRKQTYCNELVGDMARIADDKARIFEELETQRFQKELNQLILDQYRDEIQEQKQIIKDKKQEKRDY